MNCVARQISLYRPNKVDSRILTVVLGNRQCKDLKIALALYSMALMMHACRPPSIVRLATKRGGGELQSSISLHLIEAWLDHCLVRK